MFILTRICRSMRSLVNLVGVLCLVRQSQLKVILRTMELDRGSQTSRLTSLIANLLIDFFTSSMK